MEGKPHVQEVPGVTRQDLRKSTQRNEDQTQGGLSCLRSSPLAAYHTEADSTLLPAEATPFSLFIYITQE